MGHIWGQVHFAFTFFNLFELNHFEPFKMWPHRPYEHYLCLWFLNDLFLFDVKIRKRTYFS